MSVCISRVFVVVMFAVLYFIYFYMHMYKVLRDQFQFAILHILKQSQTVDAQRVEGKKEMFLFNDALNTWIYGVGHVVKVNADRERNPAATNTWATLSN